MEREGKERRANEKKKKILKWREGEGRMYRSVVRGRAMAYPVSSFIQLYG